MLELQNKVLEIKLGAEQYNVQYPTLQQYEDFMKALEGKSEIECYIEFLDKLGLPKEVSKKMQVHNLYIIAENINKVDTEKK